MTDVVVGKISPRWLAHFVFLTAKGVAGEAPIKQTNSSTSKASTFTLLGYLLFFFTFFSCIFNQKVVKYCCKIIMGAAIADCHLVMLVACLCLISILLNHTPATNTQSEFLRAILFFAPGIWGHCLIMTDRQLVLSLWEFSDGSLHIALMTSFLLKRNLYTTLVFVIYLYIYSTLKKKVNIKIFIHYLFMITVSRQLTKMLCSFLPVY